MIPALMQPYVKNSNSDQLIDRAGTIVGVWPVFGDPKGWKLGFGSIIYSIFSRTDSTQTYIEGSSIFLKKYKWNHFMFRRSGNLFELYVDCIKDNSQYVGSNDNLAGYPTAPLLIGADAVYYHRGNLGQIRITKAARPIQIPQTIFPEGVNDPYWNDVLLLTKPVDDVLVDLKGHILTSHNGAALDINTPHFGLPTISLNGINQYYDAGVDNIINSLGLSDFTIEGWGYCS